MENAKKTEEQMLMDKMTGYIQRTHIDHKSWSYFMHIDEVCALVSLSKADIVDAIYLAFDYGQAKGCRMARAEAKRKARAT